MGHVAAGLGLAQSIGLIGGQGVAGAAGAGGIGALLSSPILQTIATMVGGNFVADLFGGGQTPFEEDVARRLGISQQLIPQLQQAAAGQPTAATRAQSQQLSQAVNRLQQSFASSAQRQGIAGTTPARAQQGRLQAAKVQGLAGIMGESQRFAQQQLGALSARAPEQAFLAEAQRRESRKNFLGGISRILSEARQQEQEGIMDADTRAMFQEFQEFMKSLRGSLTAPIGG